ncbi:hypothetical protein ACQ4WP_29130 [Janthinobacterium sp. GB4P2]|uniref:hypothetical protein n=1 Tax=Janthinobacterium sp. GB4P2 TaxID=3424189 RepID=UPI003F247B56
MMKPEFYKPFDLEHARAGAPIGLTGGGTARFVAYAEEADPSCCVVVIEDRFNLIGTRRKSGRVNEAGATDNPNDLVMLPLGLINGKPVFVGDVITAPDCKGSFPADAQMNFGDGTVWTWPTPPRAYPETRLSFEALCVSGSMHLTSTNSIGIRALANAALRHACEADQVVPKDESEDAVRKAYADGQAAAFKHEAGSRAARDLAVAQAARAECVRTAEAYRGSFNPVAAISGMVTNDVLAAIIASLDQSLVRTVLAAPGEAA